MSAEEKDTLIEYIVKNQHALTYDLAKKMETMKKPDSNLKGKNIKEWIFEIPELLGKIDSANLMILASISSNEHDEKIIDELITRSMRGEAICYGGKVESQVFVRYELNLTTFIKVFEKYPQIRDRILNQEVADIKTNPRLLEIARKAKNIRTIEALYGSQKNGDMTDEALEFLELLIKQNPNILDTMDMRMLTPEILKMNKKFLERVARYKDQATELVTIYKTNPELFKAFSSRIDEWEDTLSRRKVTNLEKVFLRNASVYAPSMNDAIAEDFEDVLDFCLRNNSLAVHNRLEYRKGIMEDYYKIYDSMIEKKDFNGNPDKFSVPDAYCMKYLGANAREIQTMFERKLGNIDLEKIGDQRLKDYISRVKQIVSLDFENPQDLEKIVTLYKEGGIIYSPRDVIAFEEQANSIILGTYEQGFEDTKKGLEQSQDVEILDFNGKKIRKINMTGKFSMVIRSTDTGFKADKGLENDSLKAYEESNPDPAVTIKSCTYITEDFLGIAPLGDNGGYFVYLNNDRNNMGEIGNGDLNSNIINYGVSSQSSKSLTSETLVDNSRQIYAETTLLDRTKPDMIALFDDSTPRQQALAMQAAAEYGVDIIYFDKEKIVDEQISRLSDIQRRFKETGNLKDLATLISKYETNVAGWLLNRDPSIQDESLYVGIDNRRFLPKFNEQEYSIYKLISEYCQKESLKEDGKENLKGVVDILRHEVAKYRDLNTGNQFPPLKMKFKAFELIEILNKKYELGLEFEQSENVSVPSYEHNSDEVLISIIGKALGPDMATSGTISNGERLIEGLTKDRGVPYEH